MTPTCTTPAFGLPIFRKALLALGLALGLSLTALPAQQAAAGTLTYTIAGQTVTAPSWTAKVAVWTALAQRGDPYVWAGDGPSSFDCSGLTQYSYGRAGVSLPHSSSGQSSMGYPVAQSSLRAGDLVFFYSPVSHVGIYVGAGYVVHAPSSGDVVRMVRLSDMSSYAGARRVG